MLPREFYNKDTVIVARNILGKRIIRKIKGTVMTGIIVETEAYRHTDDPASHAFANKTERNKAMFEEVGHAYVYFTYGMHYCFNVVARHPKSKAGAVLIRAIEPEKGIKRIQKNRGTTNLKNLTNGPAKLTQALEITKDCYGTDLTKDSKLYIEDGVNPRKIYESPRIGIKKATDKLWNFKMNVKKI